MRVVDAVCAGRSAGSNITIDSGMASLCFSIERQHPLRPGILYEQALQLDA